MTEPSVASGLSHAATRRRVSPLVSALVLGLAAMLAGAGPVAGAPSVRSEATVRWSVQWTFGWDRGFDLDSAKVTSSTATMDVWLVFSAYPPPSGLWVVGPVYSSGSRLRAWAGRPSYTQCKNNRTWEDAAGPMTDPNGTWLCVRTSGNRVARLRILHWPTSSERYFRFSYLTWQRG